MSVQSSLSGLQGGRGYHFRLSASNSIGISAYGSDKTFTTAPQAHDPILFVHGWEGDETAFETFSNWFQQDGWPASRLYRWSYNTNQSNTVTAQEISSRVNTIFAATGSKVDLVTHSMGGLSSRYYLKFLNGTTKVEDWVSLAGPNHGTNTIAFCLFDGCKDMIPNSPILQALNAGDETPGAVRYATWKSGCDLVVEPPVSVEVSGAVFNTWTSCLFHTQLHEDFPTYKEVREFIR